MTIPTAQRAERTVTPRAEGVSIGRGLATHAPVYMTGANGTDVLIGSECDPNAIRKSSSGLSPVTGPVTCKACQRIIAARRLPSPVDGLGDCQSGCEL